MKPRRGGDVGGFRKSESGAAAVEFALWLAVLLYPMVNAVDLGLFAYQRTAMENAAEMALQSAFNVCGQTVAPPLISKCGTSGAKLTAAITSGVHSTNLGTAVSVSNTYECQDGSVTSGQQSPPSCPSSTGDYIGITVTYTYRPLFGRASIVNLLSSTMTRTYWMRMT
jgi:Flp pilus assembly protein TadG